MRITFNLIIVLFVIILIYIIVPHIAKKIIRYRFLNSLKESQDIYLTFDDGPDPQSTPQIIKALKKHGFTATFFITGIQGDRHPELVEMIRESGNNIGMHGYNHIHPWKSGPVRTLREIWRMNAYFNKIVPGIRLYRPPYGKFNIASLLYFLIKKHDIIFWNIDPEDYKVINPETAADEIINQINPGSVILLHDGRNDPPNQSSVKSTVRIAELLADYAIKNNVKLRAL